MAKDEEEVKNTLFGFGTSNDAYAKYFTGKSYLNPLATKANCNISNVNFEPGCINEWHEHTVPQILFVLLVKAGYKKRVSQLTR